MVDKHCDVFILSYIDKDGLEYSVMHSRDETSKDLMLSRMYSVLQAKKVW